MIDLISLRLAKRPRRPRQSAIAPPDALALRYAAAVDRLLREWRAEIKRAVFAALDDLPGVRYDSPAMIEHARVWLHRRFSEIMRDARVSEIVVPHAVRVARRSKAELERVIGIPLDDTLPTATIQQFARDNVAKIQGLARSELDSVFDVVQKAQVQGLRVEQLRENIVERFGVSESYGALLARDQTLKLAGRVNQERQTQAGIMRYRWVSSRDERVRPEHRDLDGSEQSWAVPPVTSKDGRRNHPGQDYQCRCTATPVLDDVL